MRLRMTSPPVSKMGPASLSPSLLQSSKVAGFVLSTFSHTICNITSALSPETFHLRQYPFLSEAEKTVTILLWQPRTFLAAFLRSAWDLITGAPPLIQLLLVYLMARFVIYKHIDWAVKDYQAYLDLGRGGSPCDLWGWWRVTRLKFMAAIDVFEPPHVPPMMDPYRGLLWRLPGRNGERPIVRGIAPQRQINQKTHVDTFEVLLKMIRRYAKAYPDLLCVEKSFLEGHTSALKLSRFLDLGVPNTAGEFGYEICHPHRVDGSLHMIMHPEDVRTVIEAGWGERHPLATDKWYWRMWYHVVRQRRKPVPEYMVLIYAPRNHEELRQVHLILKAAIWFATRKVLNIDGPRRVKGHNARNDAHSPNLED